MSGDEIPDGVTSVRDTKTTIDCPQCGFKIVGIPSADHHPGICRNCGVEISMITTRKMMDGIRSIPKSEKTVNCLSCGSEIAPFPSLDHHPGICRACGTNMFVFSTMNRNILIDMKRASEEVTDFIRWAQSNLDGFDFLQLILALEQALCPQSSQDGNQA